MHRAPEIRDGPCLGYDVGWWVGYSIVADSIVAPRWHGPPDDAVPEVVQRLACLNGCCLFPDPVSAEEFLAWYRTTEWGEKEPPVFDVIQVMSECR